MKSIPAIPGYQAEQNSIPGYGVPGYPKRSEETMGESNINHFATVVQAKLEPLILAEVFVQTMRSPSVITVVQRSICCLANGMLR